LQNGETNCLTYVVTLALCQAHNKYIKTSVLYPG